MAENDTAPSSVTLAAHNLLRQGLGVEEVSRRTGLPFALVELIAAEQSRPSWEALVPGRDTQRWRRDRIIATALTTLAISSAAMSLLAVHLYIRPRR